MSPGEVTDDVTLFLTSKSDDLFIVIEVTSMMIFYSSSYLSAFPGHRLPSVLVNSVAKIFRLLLGCHPLGWCHRERSAPLPSDANA